MTWLDFFNKEKEEQYFIDLMKFVKFEYQNYICHPDYDKIFEAFKLTKFNDCKVVILGQDPYHNFNQAHGLSFSVISNKLPPSLLNIYKEMEEDLNINVTKTGNLTYLANQGVLLLNSILTVRHNMPLSHANKGWEILTDKIIKLLNDSKNNICFVLWGNNAIKKEKLITNKNHLIIKSAHPSPLSSYHGFFGSKPFSKINEYLKNTNQSEIRWNIEKNN